MRIIFGFVFDFEILKSHFPLQPNVCYERNKVIFNYEEEYPLKSKIWMLSNFFTIARD